MLLRNSSRFLLLSLVTIAAVQLSGAQFVLSAPATTKPKAAPAKPAGDKPAADKAGDKPAAKTPEPVLENVMSTNAEDLVSKPQDWLGKNVKFNANFFAFSSLALDYKPAFKSSKTHLSFLILKPNSHIPLSELKLAMMIPKEKDPENTLLATLKDGDQLEITGKVFSAALDDPWVEVFKVKKVGASAEDKDKDKDKTASADKEKSEKVSEDKDKPAGKGEDKEKPAAK